MTIEELIAAELPFESRDLAMETAKRILNKLLSCKVDARNEDHDYIAWRVTTTHDGKQSTQLVEDPAEVGRWNRLVRGGRCS